MVQFEDPHDHVKLVNLPSPQEKLTLYGGVPPEMYTVTFTAEFTTAGLGLAAQETESWELLLGGGPAR